MRFRSAVVAVCVAALALGACGGGGGSSSAFCSKARAAEKKFKNASADQLDEVQSVLESLAKSAPSEIKGDMQTIVEFNKKLGSGDMTGELDPKYEQASDKLNKYLEEECGIKLSDGSPDTNG